MTANYVYTTATYKVCIWLDYSTLTELKASRAQGPSPQPHHTKTDADESKQGMAAFSGWQIFLPF